MTDPVLPSRGGAYVRTPEGDLIAVETPEVTYDASLERAAQAQETPPAPVAAAPRRRPAKED